jgi:regulator of protease activity HflC (stomatin/prohibitin superfamily)
MSQLQRGNFSLRRKNNGGQMAKLYFVGIGVLIVALLVSLRRVAPDAGHEAVLIKKPWIFGHGGVDSSPVVSGATWVAFSTDAVIVSRQPQQFGVHFEDLMSSDGVPLDFDAVIRLQITDTVRLIKDFGPNWYQNNIIAEFQNRVRQAVRKHGMNETAISTKAIEEIDDEITSSMQKYLESINFPAKLIQVTVGKSNPPDSVKHQRIQTASEQQRQETEKQKKLAEDQRKQAELSRAAADNAYREAMQLSPEQFLRLETINMQRYVCQKTNCTFVVGTASPILGISK